MIVLIGSAPMGQDKDLSVSGVTDILPRRGNDDSASNPLPPNSCFLLPVSIFICNFVLIYRQTMKVTEELIDQILEQGENGSLDPSPYMESLKYLLLEDEEVDMTEEDHAYMIFLGTICLESLKRNDLYKEIEDEEILFDLEDANWEALEAADGDLDDFVDAIAENFPEKDLLDFLAFSILPTDDEEDNEEPVLSSEDAQILGFVRLKAILDAILLPAV